MLKKNKTIIVIAVMSLAGFNAPAQSFCFYDPNTGPLYNNGSSGATYGITTGDFNGDGNLDVVTANSTGGNISFIPGYGNGALGSPDTITVPPVLFCITSGDFNNDGNMDVAAAGHLNVYLLNGNGNGTFQPYITYASGTSPSRIYFKEVTNDGIPDLVEACGNGIFIFAGQAAGNFLPAVQYTTGGAVIDLTVADFDADSVGDMVTTTSVTPTISVLSFLKGNANGIFSAAVSYSVPDNHIFGINSTDADNNGTMDLIVSNFSITIPRMEIYAGNGNGTFASPVFYPAFYRPIYVSVADMDNDQVEDIVAVETSGFIVLKGYANGTFGAYEHFVVSPAPNDLSIGDYDEDGRLDVIVPSGAFGLGTIGINLNCTITGIEETASPAAVYIFPNPFHSSATITFEKELPEKELIIYDVRGKEISRIKNIAGKKITIDRNNLSPGIYLYKLTDDNKFIGAGKLVVE